MLRIYLLVKVIELPHQGTIVILVLGTDFDCNYVLDLSSVPALSEFKYQH